MNRIYRHCFAILAVALFIIIGQVGHADDTLQVTANGIGHTSDEALKDAYKNAVRRAVGVYVLSETVMDNEEIDEKVYANSDGVVSSHEVLDTKTLPNGLLEITIKATVQKNNIGQILSNKQSTVIDKKDIINVGNSLNAMEEVQKSLDLIFKDYPASLLTVEAVGQPVLDETKNVTADTLPLKQTLRISVNYSEYQKLVKKLTKLFDQNNYPKGTKQALTRSSIRQIRGNNVLFILTRRNPSMPTKTFQDLDGIGYRLPGQITRYLKQIRQSHHLCFIQFEMLDADSNVLIDNVYFGVPYFLRIGEIKEIYDRKEGGLRIELNGGNEQHHVGLLCPLFFCKKWATGEEISDWMTNPLSAMVTDNWRDVVCSGFFTFNFQVNRKLFENAQGLKIKVSIQNQKEEENLTP